LVLDILDIAHDGASQQAGASIARYLGGPFV
jgi:hypothetical protein